MKHKPEYVRPHPECSGYLRLPGLKQSYMIRIRHKDTGAILLTVDADTLDGADLSNRKLAYADLANCSLRAADLTNTDLSHADLRSANLSIRDEDMIPRGALLNGANLTHADLTDANLERTGFIDANLSYAKLSHTNLRGSCLDDADLSHAEIVGGVLTYASFMHTNLRHAVIADIDLTRVSFKTALLDGTTFRNSANAEEDAWPENYEVDRSRISFKPSVGSDLTPEFIRIRAETVDCICEAFISEMGEGSQGYVFDWEFQCEEHLFLFRVDDFMEIFPTILIGMLQNDPVTLFSDCWMCLMSVFAYLNVDDEHPDDWFAGSAAHRVAAFAQQDSTKKWRNESFVKMNFLQAKAILAWLHAIRQMPGADDCMEFENDYPEAVEYWTKRAGLAVRSSDEYSRALSELPFFTANAVSLVSEGSIVHGSIGNANATQGSFIEKAYPILLKDGTPFTWRLRLNFPQKEGDEWASTVTHGTPSRSQVNKALAEDSLGSLFRGLSIFHGSLKYQTCRFGIRDFPESPSTQNTRIHQTHEFIADRSFELKQAGKADAEVRVGLTALRFDTDSHLWHCTVQVEFPDETRTHISDGTEPMLALVSACKMAYSEMQTLKSRFGESITLRAHNLTGDLAQWIENLSE